MSRNKPSSKKLAPLKLTLFVHSKPISQTSLVSLFGKRKKENKKILVVIKVA